MDPEETPAGAVSDAIGSLICAGLDCEQSNFYFETRKVGEKVVRTSERVVIFFCWIVSILAFRGISGTPTQNTQISGSGYA
jgi:hypothetical protein